MLAGPGAGKTYCLIERVRHLIEQERIPPERICCFTFTNKAADEIAERLERDIGPAASAVKRSTLHAFCAELLREFHAAAGLPRGFGIADEEYQRSALSRLGQPARWQTKFLQRVALHRFLGYVLQGRDRQVFGRYEAFLERRHVVDFDSLVLHVAKLLEDSPLATEIRGRWSYLLVDEFQDLNPIQYAIVRSLASEHHNIFAVGDDEQSIYSWTGADPKLFHAFVNDFAAARTYTLAENRRCPAEVVAYARRLVMVNTPIFAQSKEVSTTRRSPHEVRALTFADEEGEIAWVIADLLADRTAAGRAWGDYAVLYRKHRIGHGLEAEFLKARVPCRLAQGRALADDPIVQYVLAALQVIARPTDSLHADRFLQIVLPPTLIGELRAQAESRGTRLLVEADRRAREATTADVNARKIRRAQYALSNLPALGAQHKTLGALIEELLAQRVGPYQSILEERSDEITDPLEQAEALGLAQRIERARDEGRPLAFAPMGGVDIPLSGMLQGAGLRRLTLERPGVPAEVIQPSDAPTLGIALAFFKALQVVAGRDFVHTFHDYTALDLETTGRDLQRSEIVEVAAVRVRGGAAVGEFHRRVKPAVPIELGASRTHGIYAEDIADAPSFAEVWPDLMEFLGDDILVAHHGYEFDFPILRRMVKQVGHAWRPRTYDTLPLARDLHPGSRRLGDLAHVFGIDPGTAHRAMDDTRTLVPVFDALNRLKVQRARKAALSNVLDHLGVALALSPALSEEAQRFAEWARPFTLGRFSEALEWFRRKRDALDPATRDRLPTMDQVIEKLGGTELMLRIRAERSADQRYPVAMARLRRLLDTVADRPLNDQIERFLERAVLSRHDGVEADKDRVNLLTLHSTKGLEFSRVYIVGVEDAEFLNGSLEQTPESDAEEARRLLYVGMTRTIDRLVMTRAEQREGETTGGYRFLVEMGLPPSAP